MATTTQLPKSRSRCPSRDARVATVIQKSGLAPGLVDLVNYRVSQINGCAFCLDMHSKDLRARARRSNAFICSRPGVRSRICITLANARPLPGLKQ